MHRDAAYADRPRAGSRRDELASRPRCERLGRRGRARRAARLPQRAGHRARADRHDRPADGLRHHRRRARLRAREVQEARGRRLLQDRQPVGAGGARAASATRERADRARSSRYVSRHHHASTGAPHVNRESLLEQGPRPTPRSTRSRRRCRACSTLAQRVRAVGDRRRRAHERLGIAPSECEKPGFNLLTHARLHRRADRRGQRRRSAAA